MAEGSARILLVDDEQSVQTLLTYPLRRDGYEVIAAQDGQEALRRFAEQRFDLVVLDLEMGADDYITKPFSMREFRSRVKAALRRSRMPGAQEAVAEPITSGELHIDFERRAVTVRGQPVRLTYVEFEILAALARAPGRVLSRETLLEHVWGDSEYRDPRTVDVHIRHLREKVERDSRRPEYLLTVRGVGYRFREES
jgi:DNA-binding response OmpR family regulator